MANPNGPALDHYHDEMDGPAHEQAYDAFTHFTTVAAIFVASCVVALAVGGVKHGWISAIVMIVANIVATTIGLFSPALAWRPPAVVLVLLLLMLLVY